MNKIPFIPILFASCLHLQGATVFDEFSDGDLSSAFNAPTPISLTSGNNTIFADVGNNGETGAVNGSGVSVMRDADFFTVVIAAGQQLNSIIVNDYSSTGPAGSVSFIGYTTGSVFSGQSFADLTGNTLFNADLLPDLTQRNLLSDADPADSAARPSLAGGPLSAGSYTFWIQETGNLDVFYELTLAVTSVSVPEPSSSLLFTLGCLSFALRRKR